MQTEKKDKLILYMVTCILSVIPALFLTAPAFEDGLGTMATAAYVTGHDWSSFLAEDGYYYKYGQAVWYILPFTVVPNVVIRYRVMLVINTLLTSIIPVLVYHIVIRFFQMSRRDSCMVAFLIGIYPSILLYNKYTWAESTLFVLPWILARVLLSLYCGKNISRTRVNVDSLLVAFFSVSAFMTHQRGLIVVLATLVAIFALEKKSKYIDNSHGINWKIYLVSLAGMMILDRFLSTWQKAHVYAGVELKHNTLSVFLYPEIYQKLFSVGGMKVLVSIVMGWLFNAASSSYGIGLLGLCVMLGIAFRMLRKKTECIGAEEVISLYGLLCFIGAFALGVLFFFECIYDYFTGTAVERSDHLLFGRYLESILPVLVFVGLLWIYKVKNIYMDEDRHFMKISGGIQIGLFLYYLLVLKSRMQYVDCYVHSLMSMNLFMDTSDCQVTQSVIPNYVEAIAVFGFVSLLIYGIVILERRHKRWMFGILVVMFLLVYVLNCSEVIGRIDGCAETKYAKFYLEQDWR